MSIDYLDNITGLYIEIFPEQVKQSDEVADLARKQAAALFRDLNHLFFSHAVLAELTHEFLHLVYLTEVEVGEGTEDVVDLSLWDLVIEVEQELNLLNLFLKVLSADQLGALKKGTHRLLIWNTLSLHGFKVLSEFLFGLAQDIGVPDCHSANRVHLESLFVDKETLECVDPRLLIVNEDKLRVVSHDKANFFL